MLKELKIQYYEKFKEYIELPLFLELDEDEQIKILKQCLKYNQRIYKNNYFNDNYMEEVIRKE